MPETPHNQIEHNQSNERSAPSQCAVAKSLAPEEIHRGDYVAVLHVVCELPSFLWCADAATLPPNEPVRMPFTPTQAGLPLKVKSICLPFVLVKHPTGEHESLDIRQCRLARLDRGYAEAACRTLKKRRRKKRRSR